MKGQSGQRTAPDFLFGGLGSQDVKQGIKCKRKSRDKTTTTGEIKEDVRNTRAEEVRPHWQGCQRSRRDLGCLKSPGKGVGDMRRLETKVNSC